MINFLIFDLLMQPWHCIILIIITLSLFCYGLYFQSLKKENDGLTGFQLEPAPVESPAEKKASQNAEPEIQAIKSLSSSESWAEHKVLLFTDEKIPELAVLHSDALESTLFLVKLHQLLDESPTAKEQILNPFQSIAFKQNETQILRSLFSTRENPRKKASLYLVCRGHSMKTSLFLTKAIMESYRKAILEDSLEKPLITRFQKYREKIAQLQKERQSLLEQVQRNSADDENSNIEEIALLSELHEISSDLGSLNETLKSIESIHQNDKNPLMLLEVERIAKEDKIRELTRTIDDLRLIHANERSNEFIFKEVTRNLKATERKLIGEIALVIEGIKLEASSGLARKITLEERLITLREQSSLAIKSDKKYLLLKRVDNQIAKLNSAYLSNYKVWEIAKKSYGFGEIEVIK